MNIAIVGLGHVGLPLSLQFARSGVRVIGLGIDQGKIDKPTAGRPYVSHIAGDDIVAQTKTRLSVPVPILRRHTRNPMAAVRTRPRQVWNA